MANAIEDVEAVKTTINDALETISEKFGFGPRESYKALRGLAFQAFGQLIESGEFKQLVKDAQLNAKHLPRGWGMASQADREAAEAEEVDEKPAKKKPAAKAAPAKKAAAKKATPAEDEADKAPAPKKRRPRRAAASE